MRFKLIGILAIEGRPIDENDPDEVEWFQDIIRNGKLILHSNREGEEVGRFQVLSIEKISDKNNLSHQCESDCLQCHVPCQHQQFINKKDKPKKKKESD